MKFFVEESSRNRLLHRLPFWLQMTIIMGLIVAGTGAWYAYVYRPLTTWRAWYTQQEARMQTIARTGNTQQQPDDALATCKKKGCIGANERLTLLFNSLKTAHLTLTHCTQQQSKQKNEYLYQQYTLRVEGSFVSVATWLDALYNTVPFSRITTYQLIPGQATLTLECTLVMLCIPVNSTIAPVIETPALSGEMNSPFAQESPKELTQAWPEPLKMTQKGSKTTYTTAKPIHTHSDWKVIETTPQSLILQDNEGNMRQINPSH
ncbi:MAG: hypothetical protein WCE21_01805 [Candidatus Babeliales bacterium]